MNSSEWDRYYLLRCRALADMRPDPVGGKKVAAMIVKNGVVIGEGTRVTIKPYGSKIDRTIHAEHMAIDCACGAAAGATLYCTMEPCNKRIFNPDWIMDEPCADQIIKAGIVRVVFSEEDNSECGRSCLRLHNAGIQTTYMPLDDQ